MTYICSAYVYIYISIFQYAHTFVHTYATWRQKLRVLQQGYPTFSVILKNRLGSCLPKPNWRFKVRVPPCLRTHSTPRQHVTPLRQLHCFNSSNALVFLLPKYQELRKVDFPIPDSSAMGEIFPRGPKGGKEAFWMDKWMAKVLIGIHLTDGFLKLCLGKREAQLSSCLAMAKSFWKV